MVVLKFMQIYVPNDPKEKAAAGCKLAAINDALLALLLFEPVKEHSNKQFL